MLSIVSTWLQEWQNALYTQYQAIDDSAQTTQDQKHYPCGGSALSCTLSHGTHLEKSVISFSHLKGTSLPPAATKKRPELSGLPYQVVGTSTITHPCNPFAPTSHANLRFFEIGDTFWFGGGFDLTPYFGFEEDCILWHKAAKKACDTLHKSAYPTFKQACDEYFFLPHRQEARGIGGLFFDDLNTPSFEECFSFIQAVGDAYLTAYTQILNRRKDTVYDTMHRDFQCYRRGRYVEFNLLFDRGTLFGLQSGTHTESVMRSMPPKVHWPIKSDNQSFETELVHTFLSAKDWIIKEDICKIPM